MGTLMMDVAGAFPNTQHDHLIPRMEELGLDPGVIRWTSSFATGRRVRMLVDGTLSESMPADAGIPQGSPVSFVLTSHRYHSVNWCGRSRVQA